MEIITALVAQAGAYIASHPEVVIGWAMALYGGLTRHAWMRPSTWKGGEGRQP